MARRFGDANRCIDIPAKHNRLTSGCLTRLPGESRTAVAMTPTSGAEPGALRRTPSSSEGTK